MKILVTDNLRKEGVEILREEGFEVVERGKISPEELKELIRDVDAIIVRSGTRVTGEVMEIAERLKIIGRAGVGVDNIDLDAATRKGVVVMNAPTGNTISAAEHTIGLLFALARNIPQAYNSLLRGEWNRKKFTGTEIYGKTLGIIGLGRVGAHVARCALGVGMKVIAYDPFISRERAENMGVEMVEFEELLARSDIISLHVPLTPHTRYLIGEKEFEKMKDGVMIINSSRGGVIDEKALMAAIERGKVKGAALDVFEEEPPRDRSLLKFPQVIATPHLGASTLEAQYNVAVDIARQIVDALKRGIYRNAINLPQVPTEEWQRIRPYLSLSEKIGSFAGQIMESTLEEVSIDFLGRFDFSNYSLLIAGLLKGLFEVMLPGNITYVNARIFAEERGIRVRERESVRCEGFASAIRVEIEGEEKNHQIMGTLFEGRIPRIVEVDGFPVELAPEGNVLLVKGRDKPGLIGRIGGILGEKGINIARMTFSRKEKGGDALMLLNLDNPLDKESRDRVESLEDVKEVRVILL